MHVGDNHDASVLKWRQLLECSVEVEECGEDTETERASLSSLSCLDMSTESTTDSSSGDDMHIHMCRNVVKCGGWG